jgi:predicted metal-dependent HD superfamily phosphohydrolase
VEELRAELRQPADRWREGRRSRLQHWLRRPPYVTPYARMRWARRARANLAAELAAIEADSVRSRIRS